MTTDTMDPTELPPLTDLTCHHLYGVNYPDPGLMPGEFDSGFARHLAKLAVRLPGGDALVEPIKRIDRLCDQMQGWHRWATPARGLLIYRAVTEWYSLRERLSPAECAALTYRTLEERLREAHRQERLREEQEPTVTPWWALCLGCYRACPPYATEEYDCAVCGWSSCECEECRDTLARLLVGDTSALPKGVTLDDWTPDGGFTPAARRRRQKAKEAARRAEERAAAERRWRRYRRPPLGAPQATTQPGAVADGGGTQ